MWGLGMGHSEVCFPVGKHAIASQLIYRPQRLMLFKKGMTFLRRIFSCWLTVRTLKHKWAVLFHPFCLKLLLSKTLQSKQFCQLVVLGWQKEIPACCTDVYNILTLSTWKYIPLHTKNRLIHPKNRLQEKNSCWGYVSAKWTNSSVWFIWIYNKKFCAVLLDTNELKLILPLLLYICILSKEHWDTIRITIKLLCSILKLFSA